MNHVSNYFSNNKGAKLHFQYWEDSSKSYDRVIILIHGLGLHSGSYPYLVPSLLGNAYKIYALDLQGFGKSAGDKAEFNNYLDDLESFRRFIKKKEGFREIIFLGHSLGANVSLAYTLRYPDVEVRMILASPLLSSPLFSESGNDSVPLKFGDFSEDEIRVGILEKDPLVRKEISGGILCQIAESVKDIEAESGKFENFKGLFIHGEFDEISPVDNVSGFCEKLKCKNKKFVSFPRMRHDIFAEKRRVQVFDAVNLWLSETKFEYKVP